MEDRFLLNVREKTPDNQNSLPVKSITKEKGKFRFTRCMQAEAGETSVMDFSSTSYIEQRIGPSDLFQLCDSTVCRVIDSPVLW